MYKRNVLVLSLIVVFLGISLGTVSAEDIIITNTTNGGLKTAINNVSDGDTVYMENGLYTGSNNVNLTISRNITIEGKGDNVTIDAQGYSRVFNITSGVTVTLKNLKLINGKGAIFNNGGNLKIIGSSFNNNSATSGGAIYNLNGELNITNSTFIDNKATDSGGAIYSSIGKFNINNSTFTNNQADNGGAILNNQGNLNISGSNFIDNKAADSGGAIYTFGKDVTIVNSTFINNVEGNVYKPIYHFSSTVIMNNVTITPNDGSSIDANQTTNNTSLTITNTTYGGLKNAVNVINSGGTIYLENGIYKSLNNTNLTINKNLTIQGKGNNVVIDAQGNNRIFTITGGSITLINIKFINGKDISSGSVSAYGGAIYQISGNLTVNNCNFTNNTVYAIGSGSACGGAIYNNGNNLSVIKCTFTGNKATIGGAICGDGQMYINTCIFNNNQAGNYGGAISNSGNMNVFNSTFTGNKGSLGGGIRNSAGVLNVSNSTFRNNNVDIHGGAIYNCGYITVPILNVNNCNFINNSAHGSGGAIYTGDDFDSAIFKAGANCSIINSNFTNNSAYEGGGAVMNYIANVSNNVVCSISNSNFTSNEVNFDSYSGGAICNVGTLSINKSIFINNTAYILYGTTGGSIASNLGKCSITDCTFIGNKATHGGAISNYENSTLTISGCIFINNTASKNGNAIYNYNKGTCSIINSAFTNKDTIYNLGTVNKDNITTILDDGTIPNPSNNTNNSNSTNTSNNSSNKQNTDIIINNSLCGTYNQIIKLSATLKSNNNPISGKPIKFCINDIFVGQGITNSQGIATYNYLANLAGNLILMAIFDGDIGYNNSNATSILSITNEVVNNTTNSSNTGNTTDVSNNNLTKQTTAITMNDFKGTYNKIITLSATLKTGNKAITGKIVNFYVNNKYVGQATTNSQGMVIFSYKVLLTGACTVKTVFNGDNQYITSSKTNKLTVPKLSELKLINKATIKGKTAKITTTIANLGYDKGTFKLTFKLAKGLTYKKPKVSTGKINYNKKTRTLTWTITNLKVHKTKSATITWNLKAKKGKYTINPKLVKNSQVILLSNNKLSFRVK